MKIYSLNICDKSLFILMNYASTFLNFFFRIFKIKHTLICYKIKDLTKMFKLYILIWFIIDIGRIG